METICPVVRMAKSLTNQRKGGIMKKINVGSILSISLLGFIAFWIVRDEIKTRDHDDNPRNWQGTGEYRYNDSTYIIFDRIDSVYYDPETPDPPDRH